MDVLSPDSNSERSSRASITVNLFPAQSYFIFNSHFGNSFSNFERTNRQGECKNLLPPFINMIYLIFIIPIGDIIVVLLSYGAISNARQRVVWNDISYRSYVNALENITRSQYYNDAENLLYARVACVVKYRLFLICIQMIHNFIDEIEKQPIIWDMTSSGYSSFYRKINKTGKIQRQERRFSESQPQIELK